MNPKTRDLITQASVSLKRSRMLVRDASRALKEAEARLVALAKAAEPATEPAWVEAAKAEASRVKMFLWDEHKCHTNVHVQGDADGVREVRVLLKDCVVWSRSERGCTDIDNTRVRGLLSEKWRDFL